MSEVKVYFSDFFDVDEDIISAYGAVNISLINDLPLFIDPFLLFNSDDPAYQQIHQEMINYLRFLQDQAQKYKTLHKGMKDAWFSFPEVKQTWLGFSLTGNAGRGMGDTFAEGLFTGLNTIFKDFGESKITKSPHMEKLCLISEKVGRDKISDFTTNFAKLYLLEYTQKFAKEYLEPDKCKVVAVPRATFNKTTRTWEQRRFYLPYHDGDYVLLTPKAMLTRDDTFINRRDMLERLRDIAVSIADEALRFELNQYFAGILSSEKKPKKKELEGYADSFVREHPEIIDYYVKYKEDHEEQATSESAENVRKVEFLFNEQIGQLIQLLQDKTDFYSVIPDAYEEALKRALFLKHVIEDQDGYKLFYLADGTPLKREADLQVIYQLVWFGSPLDVNREVNNGRGAVDYKISYGKKNSSLVEFKLASNSKLKQNLANQVEVYKKASETERAVKVILFFTDAEQKKLNNTLNDLGLAGNESIVLIDARNDKVSASNVK